MTPAPWIPVLPPSSHIPIQRLVAEFERRLLAMRPSDNVGLAHGECGPAVFWAERYADTRCDAHLARVHDLVSHAFDVVEHTTLDDTLSTGLAGVAWSVDYIDKRLGEYDGARTADVLDALATRLNHPWLGPLGLLEGLGGVAMYLLGRLPDARAKTVLEKLLIHLFELSERRQNDWSTWQTDVSQMTAALSGRRPRSPHYDLTVGFGVPGLVAVLFEAMRAGVAEVIIRRLLDRCFTWLLTHQDASTHTLPRFTGSDRGTKCEVASEGWAESRAAVFAVLFQAASTLGRKDFLESALRWTLAEATELEQRLNDGEPFAVDLLGGSAGLAHTYARLFYHTRDALFARLARRWLTVTAATLDEQLERDASVLRFGLLDGACGAALALLAGVRPIEPAWDRILLLSSTPL